ncbi:MAG TPA: hypothetical protein VKA89_05305 [Solirubrobacterales bacterium]|nr:hypothetical protein [Solirubrobacterales bacterium]
MKQSADRGVADCDPVGGENDRERHQRRPEERQKGVCPNGVEQGNREDQDGRMHEIQPEGSIGYVSHPVVTSTGSPHDQSREEDDRRPRQHRTESYSDKMSSGSRSFAAEMEQCERRPADGCHEGDRQGGAPASAEMFHRGAVSHEQPAESEEQAVCRQDVDPRRNRRWSFQVPRLHRPKQEDRHQSHRHNPPRAVCPPSGDLQARTEPDSLDRVAGGKRDYVKDREVPEEPEVQGLRGPAEQRLSRGGAGNRDRSLRERDDRDESDNERDADSLHPAGSEAPRAPFLDHKSREEPRDQEEERQSEGMQRVADAIEQVLRRPGGWAPEEAREDRTVVNDPEQHRDGSQPVQLVNPADPTHRYNATFVQRS